jgi:hypothetical protein
LISRDGKQLVRVHDRRKEKAKKLADMLFPLITNLLIGCTDGEDTRDSYVFYIR